MNTLKNRVYYTNLFQSKLEEAPGSGWGNLSVLYNWKLQAN